MKMTTLRTHVAVLALAVLALSTAGQAQYDRLSRAPAGDPVAVPMTAEHWETKENAEFLRELGFYRGLMRLNSGNAVLKGTTFSDGTIEFDVNTIGRGSPGIAFRQQDNDNFELLYLRPDPACPAFRACMQYAPQTHGVLLWDLFPQYQTRAPLRDNGWNHIKMIVSGRRMNVFVNDVSTPTLKVGSLEGDAVTGGVRLQGPGTFANMVITPGAVDGLPPEPVADAFDTEVWSDAGVYLRLLPCRMARRPRTLTCPARRRSGRRSAPNETGWRTSAAYTADLFRSPPAQSPG